MVSDKDWDVGRIALPPYIQKSPRVVTCELPYDAGLYHLLNAHTYIFVYCKMVIKDG